MEKIIDKISKLLNLSKSPNMQEASIALEKAHTLLKEHNLKMEDIKLEKSDLIKNSFIKTKRLVNWKFILCDIICLYNYCSLVKKQQYESELVVYGREENVISSKLMFEYLVSAIDRIAKNERKLNRLFNMNDFKLGASYNLISRIQKFQYKENTDNEKALVPVLKEAEDYMKKDNSNLIKAPIRESNSGSTYLGYEKAKSISLNNQITKEERLVSNYLN
jgi:hypothetical protein